MCLSWSWAETSSSAWGVPSHSGVWSLAKNTRSPPRLSPGLQGRCFFPVPGSSANAPGCVGEGRREPPAWSYVVSRFAHGVRRSRGQPARGRAVTRGLSGPKRGFVSTSVQGTHRGNPHPFPGGVTLTLCHPDLALCCFIVVCSGRHRAAGVSMGQGPGPFGCLWRRFSQSCNNPVLTGPRWQRRRRDVSSWCAHGRFPVRLRPSCLGQPGLRCCLSSQP